MLAKYVKTAKNPDLPPLTTNEFTVKNYFNFAEKVVSYDNLWLALLLNRYLLITLWKKLLKTVSETYFPTISIAVN